MKYSRLQEALVRLFMLISPLVLGYAALRVDGLLAFVAAVILWTYFLVVLAGVLQFVCIWKGWM